LIGDDHKPTGEHISLRTGIIETLGDFCYLRSWIAESNKNMNTRKTQAWTAINKHLRIWKASQLSCKLKLHVFRTTVEAILLYGSQCWT